MNFQDALLQKCYASALSEAGEVPEDLRPIHALMATHDWLAMLEGTHSARVHETIEHLLSAPLRPALRTWYQRRGLKMDSAAVEFRDRLSRLAEERLEIAIPASREVTGSKII